MERGIKDLYCADNECALDIDKIIEWCFNGTSETESAARFDFIKYVMEPILGREMRSLPDLTLGERLIVNAFVEKDFIKKLDKK